MKKTTYLFSFVIVLLAVFLFTAKAQAKTVEVTTQDEIEDVTDNMTEDTTIILKGSFFDQRVFIVNDSNYKLTIDGENQNYSGKFEIETEEAGIIHVKNMIFDGNNSDASSELGMELNTRRNPSDNMQITLENAEFKNFNSDTYQSPLIIPGDYGDVLVDNVLFENNAPDYSGGISGGEGAPNITLQNSTFITQNYEEQEAEALYFSGLNNKLTIENTKFIHKGSFDETDPTQKVSAILIDSLEDEAELNIESSSFDSYQVFTPDNRYDDTKGAALSIYNIYETGKVNIKQSTFSNNHAIDHASVIGIEQNSDEDTVTNITIENSTFYNNTSINKDNLNKVGTILIKEEETDSEGIDTNYTGTNNTFYKNSIESKSTNFEPAGAALNFMDGPNKVTVENDVFTGNSVEKAGIVNTSSNYTNVNLFTGALLTQTKNIDFDNGAEVENDVKKVYGKYPITLSENAGKIKAGRPDDAEIIKTLPIAPKLLSSSNTLITGLANEYANAKLTEDQRGFKRLGKHDAGAVEISSVVYDSNGGKFTLPELTKYDGKTYYEGKNPTQYAKVSTPGNNYTIIDGKKVLNPTKTNYTFIGWSTKKDSKLQDNAYKTATKHTVDDQLVLYAIWKENKYTVQYYGNGNTTGVEPTQKSVGTNTKITVKKAGTLKKKGYKFAGWASKATSRKADAKLAPGKKVTVTKKTQFYAVWKR